MELVMRVLVEVEEEYVQEWAEYNKADVDQQISWLKEEVEKFIEKAKSDLNVASNVSFIEWED